LAKKPEPQSHDFKPNSASFPGKVRGSIPSLVAATAILGFPFWSFDKSSAGWLEEHAKGRPVFVSDNPAYDWQFINYYFHRFLGRNPFGFSGRRIGDLYAGLVRDASKATEWKKYRVTAHSHNPVDDAKGNAEALKKFRELGLKL
jgi:hypothetical protein